MLEANHGKSNTAFGAVVVVADALYNGAFEYARSTNTRRTLCALLSDSCDDLDPSRVRTYEAGGYGLGQIDADAHSRVVYGKCRTQYLQGEKKVQMKLVRRAGGLAGFGLARASTADHSVNPADPTTFTVYSSRSKLDAPVAKVGVLIGNALPQTERFWSGAVALIPADSGASSDWGTAVAWLRDGRVVRLMLNIVSDSNLGELPGALNTVYGSPGSTAGPVTSWKLNDGGEARLDIGAALSLVVEFPAARMASAPTALSAAPAASAGPVAPTLPSVTASPSDRSGPGPTKSSKRPASHAASSTPDPFGGPDPLPSEPAAKKKGNCGCASGDMMCAMKCGSR